METVMIIGTLMSVVGSIQAGNAQASALNQQAKMYEKQATIYNSQIVSNTAENERRIAVEKAATAQESLQRTEKLQRIMASTVAAGAAAGISTQYGTITSLNENSSYQAGNEEGVSRMNSQNRIASLNLNTAVENVNVAQAAEGAVFNANQAISSAKQAKTAGYMKAIGTLTSYGMSQYGMGGAGGSGGSGLKAGQYTVTNSGDTIRWN